MEWQQYENQHLTKTAHGCFFIYQEMQRWCLKFEPGRHIYNVILNFPTLYEAKMAAEEYAEKLGALLLPEED